MTAGSKNKNPRGFSLWQAGLMYVLLEWSVCHPSSRLEPCLWRRDAPVSAFPRLVLQAALGWLCRPPPGSQGVAWGIRISAAAVATASGLALGLPRSALCDERTLKRVQMRRHCKVREALLRPRRASVTHAAALVPAPSRPGRRLLCRLRPRSRAGSAGPWAPAAAL